jgi:hypothetical protein
MEEEEKRDGIDGGAGEAGSMTSSTRFSLCFLALVASRLKRATCSVPLCSIHH